MTKEEEQLLLIDLCARLPYGVKCNVGNITVTLEGITEDGEAFADGSYFDAYDMKPYLRSMSSMTEEEREEYIHILEGPIIYDENSNLIIGFECNTFEQFVLLENWLNSHHFDFRDLIQKGLALEAPEGMYKTE